MPYSLRLELADGPRRIPLEEGETLLGSGGDCALRIPHLTISRRHARLRIRDERLTVEDLRSRNGTRVDGRRIEGEVPVGAGSHLLFGGVEALVEETGADDVAAAVLLAPSNGETEVGEAEGEGATLSVGTLRRFTLDELPELLASLERGEEGEGMARRVGTALLRSLPCRSVEVVRRVGEEEAVLFRSSPGLERAGGEPAVVGRREIEIRVAFHSAGAVRSFLPLLETGASLIALAGRADGPSSSRVGASPDLDAARPPVPESVSPRVERLYRDAARVARGGVTVLICGESGTGKELLARFLHRSSAWRDGPFVPLNCAALPSDLLEAELFGIEKGVATGVVERPGKFELADGGTLFLDEIGDMAPEIQAKVLRVLQEGEVYRLGGRSPRRAAARIVAATNRPIDELRSSGRFREDLYHRIADWRAVLPPLRERRADIANLAAHFLAAEAKRLNRPLKGISRAALDALERYDWPGNIRQLEREIARAALFLEAGELLRLEHLSAEIVEAKAGAEGEDTGLRSQLESFERWLIVRALRDTGGEVTAAARRLGVGRSTLYRRLRELDIDADGAAATHPGPGSRDAPKA